MNNRRNLKGHQSVLVELLREADRICKKHGIQYMLFAGSALGAVRHKGIIPWDDDLDIVMTRENYNRFIEVAASELDEKYYMQSEFSQHWPMFFSKLRKNNTACIERYIPRDPKIHQGIYIDVFPCDNLSDNPFKRKIQFFFSKFVIARSLWNEGYFTHNVLKKIIMQVSRLLPVEKMWKYTVMADNNETDMMHTFFGASSKYRKSVYPRKWFEETVDMEFEGASFPVPKYYDELLTCLYGDYMKIPDESQRECKVHAILVDLENSYEKYEGIQKEMNFTGHTKSIR